MIHHISIYVSDYAKSKAFYQKALQPLGYTLMMEFPGVGGFGEQNPDIWLSQKESAQNTHVALAADTRAKVDEFYKAAIAAGGKDNGAPGIRADYSPNYYAAFVIDPDGNNIEAVCTLS